MIEARIDNQFESWRDVARQCLSAAIPPTEIFWNDGSASLLPADLQALPAPRAALNNANRVPKEFLATCNYVACHRDGDQWELMYRVLWRLTHGEPHLLELAVDEDVHRLTMLHKGVSRDRHKMTAFVRFRRIETEAGERFIAWHRPDHRIVRLTAPFFVERFAAMNWAILTPDESAMWDGQTLRFGPGVSRSAAPAADELESLWKTYYGSTFNPARINLRAMRKEMPARHWATMPETESIFDLLHEAPKRLEAMAWQSADLARPSITATPNGAKCLPLPQLRLTAQNCRDCDIHCNATQLVFGEGPGNARLVFVGEQPGDEEDRAGQPFVGPAGQLFDQMLAEAGIDRAQSYVTNVVKHFKWEPRGQKRLHKTPSAREAAICAQWLHAELRAIKPEMVVALGATAARAIFGRDFRLTASRGVPRATEWAPWTIATWHPSLLLRLPDPDARMAARNEMASDLKQAAARLSLRAAG